MIRLVLAERVTSDDLDDLAVQAGFLLLNLVARAMGALSPDARRPLTILEAMMRGHGIEVYAREVQR